MGKRTQVAPRVGAWIETWVRQWDGQTTESHPVWVRGLKLKKNTDLIVGIESHPVWVRGLKLHYQQDRSRVYSVAPRVGAWIETT